MPRKKTIRAARGGSSIARSDRRADLTQELQDYQTSRAQRSEDIQNMTRQIVELEARKREQNAGNRPAIAQLDVDIGELEKRRGFLESSLKLFDNLIENIRAEITRLNSGEPIVIHRTRRSTRSRGGAYRENIREERDLRRQIEMDSKALETWTEKAETYKQEVEVAERVLAEQRANNAPARKQALATLRGLKDRLREAEAHRDNYTGYIKRTMARLAQLDAATQ